MLRGQMRRALTSWVEFAEPERNLFVALFHMRSVQDLAHAAAERGEARVRWLTVAAYDRWLMYQGKPQKYGAQYVADGVQHRLWDVDPSTTDTERAAWNVPPLAEQLRKKEALRRWRANGGSSER
jgi:hypothetical protein